MQNIVHSETRAHTHTHTHKYSDYTKINLHSLKLAANRDLKWMKTAALNRKCSRSTVLGKEVFFRLNLNASREGLCQRGRGR